MTNNIKVGVIVNPVAGLGGAVGLKGSDGETILAQARARGATPRAGQRVAQFLEALRPLAGHIQWFCWGGPMGEDNLQQAGFAHQVCGQPGPTSGPDDTRQAALALRQRVAVGPAAAERADWTSPAPREGPRSPARATESRPVPWTRHTQRPLSDATPGACRPFASRSRRAWPRHS